MQSCVAMTFFQAPEPRPLPPENEQPEWIGPRDNVLGAAVPLRLILARTDHVAVAITEASAYPNGVELNLALRIRDFTPELRKAMTHGGPFHLHRFRDEPPGEGLPPELLRLGV
jgi:hypothetical protein